MSMTPDRLETEQAYCIQGMDCATEVNALKETVGTLSGVTDLDFNLLEGVMTVRYDAARIGEKAILDAVRRAGLEAAAVDAHRSSGVLPDQAGGWRGRGRECLCLASGALLLMGLIWHALLLGSLWHALTGGEGLSHLAFPLPVRLCYALAVVTGGWFVAPKAWLALRRRRADMNLLMTIAVLGAMIIGQWFEAATVAFLFAFSLLLESWSVGRARRAIRSLIGLTPQTARYRCPADGDIMECSVEAVPPGATVVVRPGERIPLDGIVTEGRTSVNQAPITGESLPVVKAEGDAVFAGTINEDGAFAFKATKPASETTVARIIRMVEQAQSRRAPSEQWVEKFARYYTPVMLAAAFLTAVVPPLLDGQWGGWFYKALVILVIACPCALVISTPISIVASLTAATRAGILIKGGAFLEAAGRVKVFALDKTGTLTTGRPEVQEIVPYDGHTQAELLARAAALETHSAHPLAAAVLRKARLEHVVPLAALDCRALQGRGAEGIIEGSRFWLGSHRLLREKGVAQSEVHEHAQRMEAAGCSVIVVGNDRHLCGAISVADAIRPEAPDLVRQLKAAGIRHVVMLTGDNQGTADAVGRAVGVDDVRSELLPEDKLLAIRDIHAQYGPVAMVGDGVNDAPALASATIGIAMGAAGTDAAIETADIALMSDDLTRLPWLVRHAQRALRVIRQNIVFALSVKAVFMVLALLQVATLWMAIAADMGASLLVIFNALRLLRDKQPPLQRRKGGR